MTTRKYSSRSQQTTLTSAVTSGATIIPVANAATLLGGATVSTGQTFTVVIDPDTALEEIVEVTVVSSNNLTVTRAVDMAGSAAQDHSAGAVIRHMIIGRDLRESNLHIEATGSYNDGTAAHDLHGLGSSDGVVVGTDKTQTLTNKTLASPTITGTPGVDTSIIFEGATADAYETTLTVVDPTADRTITLPNATGTVVLKDTTDTLTNKTLTSPTISGSPVITGLSSAGMSASSAAPKDYVDSILGSSTAAAASATAAATSAASASTSQIAAATSANSASASATAAATSANSASTSQIAAATSASSASASATTASAWSIQLVTPVSGSDYSAKYNANLAATSATSAAASATAAATSATSAANSVSSIAGYATAAATSATSASNSATAASTSASSAATSASSAATSATDAATTYDNFDDRYLGTKTTAPTVDNDGNTLLVGAIYWNSTAGAMYVWSGSAWVQIATTSVYTAPTLGSTAIASGTTYANVAGLTINSTTIPTSKTLVVTTDKLSALAATTSAELAGVISDETGSGSLVFATSPTLVTPVLGVATATSINGTSIPSNKTLVATDSTTYIVPSQTGNTGKYLTTDGSAASWGSISGSLAQPTEPSSPTDGLIWVDTDGTAPTTVVTRWSKSPAAGTTSLTGNDDNSIPLAYSAGYEQVFLNGVLLSRTNDYTATSGTAITLISATVAGDIVEVVCPLQIATTDTYTQSAVNNAFQANTNNFAAGKNKIINGDFGINQRNFSSTTTAAAYTFDRWILIRDAGGTTTISSQSFTPGTAPVTGYESNNFLRIATTGQTATSTYAFPAQKIESAKTFAGQTVTVSFWAKAASGTPKVAVEIEQAFGSGGSSTVTNYLGQVTLTTSWVRYSLTFNLPSIVGKTIGTNDYLELNLWVSSGTDFNSRSGSLGIQTNTFDFWGVQLEAGSVATAFQTATGTIQGELAACQRYYWRTTSGGGYVRLPMGSAQSTTQVNIPLINPVTMRTTPTTLDYSTLGGTGLVVTDFITNTTPSTFVLDSTYASSPVISYLTATVASGLTAFRPYTIGFNASTTGYIGVSAEL